VDIYALDRATGQFWKRLALTIAVNGGHVEHLNIALNMAVLYSKTVQLLNLYIKHACSTVCIIWYTSKT